MSLSRLMFVALMLACSASGANGEKFQRIVGAVTPDGTAVLVKHFQVPVGAVIGGVQFYSNDLRTTFSRVVILEGSPSAPLVRASELAVVETVRAGETHRTLVTCPGAAVMGRDVLVAIYLPASDGVRGLRDGAGVMARALTGRVTSYFASESDAHLGAMDVDYAIELLYETVSKGGSASDEAPARNLIVQKTFLRASGQSGPAGVEIRFGLVETGAAQLVVYDVAGRRVRKLMDAVLAAGVHVRSWDWRDDTGNRVAAGVYIVRFNAVGKTMTQKLLRTN